MADSKDILRNTFFPSFTQKPFGMMTKANGSLCNLSCDYCYYLEKENLYKGNPKQKMSEEILEIFIKQYIDSQPTPTVNFIWQGGEPCLAGTGFYKKAIELQSRHANGKQIENSFQTNGTLLDDEWCIFLKENNFLVGISIDGPQELHDHFRKNRAGKPSFLAVLQAINLLKKHQVDFNTLTTINQYNSDYPLEIYQFLKSIGSQFIQFLPVVERVSSNSDNRELCLVSNEFKGESLVTEFSVDPVKFGRFMISVFDEWVKQDVSYVFVQLFDASLANWIGEPPGVCMYAPACGHAGVIEHNGDVYSCDHFVFPEYFLGNITQTPLADLMNSPRQQVFGQKKFSSLPKTCLDCKVFSKCYGECPKKRFLTSPEGEYGVNYLCEGYKLFFNHIAPYMDFMANELRNERSPANIMQHLREVK